MTHYRLTDGMPSAIVLAKNPRTSSLDELKTYKGNKIFLNHGNEFQIRLFNPLKEKIGAQVSINGKKSSSLIVLNPGEDIIIDRFVDEKHRMIFETYQYDDNNPSAKKAIVNNGLIEINFFKEFQTNYLSNWTTISYDRFDNQGIYDYDTDTTTGNIDLSNIGLGNSNPTSKLDVNGNVQMDENRNLNQSSTYCCDMNLEFESPKVSLKERDLSKSLKETGIVSKGKESNQNFEKVNIQFESLPFYSTSYKLEPISEKNSQLKEVRDYCTKCGYRLRNDRWLYCPKCGEKI